MIRRSIRCIFAIVVPAACVLAASAGLAPRRAAADSPAAPASPSAPSAPSAPAGPATGPAVSHEVALLVAQLGDDDPQVRETAAKRLTAIGKSVLPALRAAAVGDDPEVANRAQRLISAFRFGIGPDTPPEMMELVKQYRSPDLNQRQRAVQQLSNMGWSGYRVLAKLRRQETDPAWRDSLAAYLRNGAQAVVHQARDLVASGAEDRAEALLEDAAAGGEAEVSNSYAALLLSRGKLDAARHELEAEAGAAPGPDDALLLARLARAAGDADAVLKYAARVGPTLGYPWGAADELKREVWLDRHDWPKLIELADRRIKEVDAANAEANGNAGNGQGNGQPPAVAPVPGAPIPPNPANRLRNRGLNTSAIRRAALADKAACARLGGKTQAFDEAIAALRQDAAENPPDAAVYYAVPLLLNGRSADGIQLLLTGKRYLFAFQLMMAQGRQEEALRLADAARNDAWQGLPVLELNAAQSLAWLGEKDRAGAIADRIAKEFDAGNANGGNGNGGNGNGPHANGGNGNARGNPNGNAPNPGLSPEAQNLVAELTRVELALGRNNRPFRRAAELLKSPTFIGNPIGVMRMLVPNLPDPANRWRLFLAEQHPGTPSAEVLAKVWGLFARKLPAHEAESLLREGFKKAGEDAVPAVREAWLGAVAEAAHAAGRDDLADAAYEKLATVSGAWFPWKYLGDRAARRRDWKRAAECYDNARQKDSNEPVCLWLHAWARGRAGDGDAAAIAAEMNRADTLLLADDTHWAGFVQAIAESGASTSDDAEKQRERAHRLLDPNAWAYNESWYQSSRALLIAGRRWFEVEDPLEDLGSDEPAAPAQAGPAQTAPARAGQSEAERCFRAADLSDRWLIAMAVGRMQFRLPGAYLSQPAATHITRARGLIERDAAGDLAAAMKEADAALAAMPANTQLPIDLVPALDRHGHKAEAEALFRRVDSASSSAVARYPNCAELHNGLAWMCAKCDRDLDKALENAEQANKLSPDTVSFLDTLAEVHFHRGERQAAIDVMKKCIELDPNFEYLQRQMKRFTAAGEGAAAPSTAPSH